MRRLRWALLLLSVALVVLISLLLERAIAHTRLEHLLRHEAVAKRLFDEMERELGDLLEREEDRAYDQYRYLYEPEGSLSGGSLSQSPLAGIPEDPFIIGYFQIDPDGTLHTPHVPRAEEMSLAGVTIDHSPKLDEVVAELERWVRGHLGATHRAERGATLLASNSVASYSAEPILPPQKGLPRKGDLQLPGTTQAYQASAGAGAGSDAEWGIIDGATGSIGVLNSLNRGITSRSARGQKIAKSPASKTRAFEQQATQYIQGEGQRAAPPRQDKPGADRGGPTPQAETVDVELDPMVARKVDSSRLLLYRTVVIGQQAYRQGLLINIPALMSTLSDKVLGDGSTAPLGEFIGGAWGAFDEPDAGGRYLFRHRFAEPYGALGGLLMLNPLPPEGGDLYIYALSALLLLLGTVGLLSVYRMVELRVSFAERRNDFVSAVTHELKTPLTAIRMYAEMLQEGMVASEEKRQQYYHTITAESERLSRLIGNVLELGRIERGARSVSLVCADIAPVLEEVVAVLGPHARRQGFTIEIDIEEGLPPVVYDRDALLQVLFNVVDNALKYAREAEDKRIQLRCFSEAGRVQLAVRDRGPGVPPTHLRRVFEPFYRGERELTRTTKGTGIGLALVKGLAERMGATVAGRNPPDGGFEVRLALATEGV